MEAGIVADQKRGGVYSELKKRILLGTLTSDQGAILQFAGALSKSDEPDPQLVLLLGVALAQGHQLQDGQNMLRMMKRLVRQNPVPTTQSFQYLLAAELALARGSLRSALQSAQEAVRYENSSFALETLARCYEATGKDEDAIREYEQVLARGNERSHSYDTRNAVRKCWPIRARAQLSSAIPKILVSTGQQSRDLQGRRKTVTQSNRVRWPLKSHPSDVERRL